MSTLAILIFPVILIFCFFLFVQVIRYYKNQSVSPKEVRITINGKDVMIGESGLPIEIETAPEKAALESTNDGIDTHDRRGATRIPFRSFVDFVLGGALHKETSQNLSKGGIFLSSTTPEKYKVDEKITLAFQLSDGQPQKHAGKIVRKTSEGMGIEFEKKK